MEEVLNEEHRALITLLPYDIVITISALSVLLLTFVSFVQRSSARIGKTLAALTAGDGQVSQRKRI
jgi:hypothetical protein